MQANAKNPAAKTKVSQQTNSSTTKAPKRGGGIIKKFLAMLLVLSLLLAAAAGAVHYNVVDLDKLDSQWGISKYPLIGRLIKKPDANLTPDEPEAPAKTQEPNTLPIQPKPVITPLPLPVDNTLLNKQALERQQEEQRRIVKVSRLYDGMKPEEAAPILNELDDATVLLIFSKMDQERVGKIMTLLEAKRSARLSNAMLKGRVSD